MEKSAPFKPGRKTKAVDPGDFELPESDTLDGACARFPLNDLGNADRLIRRFGEDVRWIEGAGWAAWDGKRWSVGGDGTRRVHQMAQKTARAIKDEAKWLKGLADPPAPPDWIEAVTKHAKASGASGRISAMQTEAAPHLTVTVDAMDGHKHLLNVANGTLELGEQVILRAHRRDDMLTRVCPVEWDDAAAPTFEEFVGKILPDPDTREFVQDLLGYCLTGDTSEQLVGFFHGSGSNGKSTLIACVAHVMGDYHAPVTIETLLADDRRSGGNATPDLARLPGARFVTAAEPEKGARISESRIKWLTGGDRMTARNLFEKHFVDFDPQFKIVISFNPKPTIKGDDDGIWRRIAMVPFEQKVTKVDVAPVYRALRGGEAPGILRWLLDGAMRWYGRGLVVPAKVRAATGDYRSDSDPIGTFLRVSTSRRPGTNVQASVLYAAYKAWAELESIEAVSVTRFGRVLKEKGLQAEKAGTVFYVGIDLTEDARAAMAAHQQRGGHGVDGPDAD